MGDVVVRSRQGSARPRARLQLLCPFRAGVNPFAAEAQAASLLWARRLGLVAGDEESRRLAAAKIGWLPARVFHSAPLERLQLAADWTTLFCLLDDRVERMAITSSLIRVSDHLSRLLNAFEDEAAIHDEPTAAAFHDLGRRVRALAPADWVHRFVGSLEGVFSGFVWETVNHTRGLKPSFDDYCTMREFTVGLYPQFLLGELDQELRLTDQTRAHPALGRLMSASSKCVALANDLFTYKKEMEYGEVHNLVILLADSTPLERAVRRVAELHDAEVRALIAAEANLPSFGAEDAAVRRFVAMLQSWIRGHLDWAKECGRYDAGVSEVERAQL